MNFPTQVDEKTILRPLILDDAEAMVALIQQNRTTSIKTFTLHTRRMWYD